MVTACGVDDTSPTPTERAAWAKAAADLRQADATPAEIARRATAFTRRWPDATLTPSALARRWAESVAAVAPTGGARPDPLELARGRGRTLAHTDCTEADLPTLTNPAERDALVDAFHVERARLAERNSA